jgi:hypothetical protein
LICSQSSLEIAPRTPRAFSRATVRQATIAFGLPGYWTTKRATQSGSTGQLAG